MIRSSGGYRQLISPPTEHDVGHLEGGLEAWKDNRKRCELSGKSWFVAVVHAVALRAHNLEGYGLQEPFDILELESLYAIPGIFDFTGQAHCNGQARQDGTCRLSHDYGVRADAGHLTKTYIRPRKMMKPIVYVGHLHTLAAKGKMFDVGNNKHEWKTVPSRPFLGPSNGPER